MPLDSDFLVIGAGVAGAAAGYELAAHGRVVVLEAEATPGYHSTGRSAALFTPNYGNRVVRALVAAARPFFDDPPAGFHRPLLSPRGALAFAGPGAEAGIDALLALSAHGGAVAEVSVERAVALVPILRREAVSRAAYEAGVMDMDVHSIHQGFLRGLAARGGRVVCDARVDAIERRGGRWRVCAGDRYSAPVLVNAAGAWADEVAALAGIAPVGLVPKRRTAVIVEAPSDPAWPLVEEAGEDRYFKPEAGKLLVSPGDATPSPPCDAAPDELDVALAVDWFERVTSVRVDRLGRRWAGLRSFVADDTPVVGEAPGAEGFYWLAGQGGYGIMLAPVLARVVASLILEGTVPSNVTAGVGEADLAPRRLRGPALAPAAGGAL